MVNNIKCDFNKLIITDRVRKSSIPRKIKVDEFYSDRSRILFCSSFRRLQQKAQVFSLEPNASVRTRLTHSLEVSDIGRTLANNIAYQLLAQKKLTRNNTRVVVAIVENACLLHDIGNPPFGHFGEAAIRAWAKAFLKKTEGNKDHFKFLDSEEKEREFGLLMQDFLEFDGNPQGFRTVTKLHTERDQYGLNLTYSTLLSILKYSRFAGEEIESRIGIMKKPGYFQSEKALVEKIHNESNLKMHRRFPFTYIMEAADDIAYCMSDIADGIEKGILTEESFLKEFVTIWNDSYRNEKGEPERIPVKLPKKYIGFNSDISIPWSKAAMQEASDRFIELMEDIFNGTSCSLIDENGKIGKVLSTVKKVSKKVLYPSIKAESIELTGYSVITGILSRYEKLLELSFEDFYALKDGVNSKTEYEKRLFNRLGNRYVLAYDYSLADLDRNEDSFPIKELWLRIHLLVDHISGMTDEYALETYQMLEGIQLLKC